MSCKEIFAVHSVYELSIYSWDKACMGTVKKYLGQIIYMSCDEILGVNSPYDPSRNIWGKFCICAVKIVWGYILCKSSQEILGQTLYMSSQEILG